MPYDGFPDPVLWMEDWHILDALEDVRRARIHSRLCKLNANYHHRNPCSVKEKLRYTERAFDSVCKVLFEQGLLTRAVLDSSEILVIASDASVSGAWWPGSTLEYVNPADEHAAKWVRFGHYYFWTPDFGQIGATVGQEAGWLDDVASLFRSVVGPTYRLWRSRLLQHEIQGLTSSPSLQSLLDAGIEKPEYWRDLGERFQALSVISAGKNFEAWYSSTRLLSDGTQWILRNENDSPIEGRFLALAEQGALGLKWSGKSQALSYWMDLVRDYQYTEKRVGSSHSFQWGVEESSTDVTIASPSKASADFCLFLETKALAQQGKSAIETTVLRAEQLAGSGSKFPLQNELSTADNDGRQDSAPSSGEVRWNGSGTGYQIADWASIEITFLSDERVEIRFGTKWENYNYGDLGFGDHRGKGKPVMAWYTLLSLAKGRGILSRPDGTAGDWVSVEKSVQDIRKRFRLRFKISEDPIPFVKGVGYSGALQNPMWTVGRLLTNFRQDGVNFFEFIFAYRSID